MNYPTFSDYVTLLKANTLGISSLNKLAIILGSSDYNKLANMLGFSNTMKFSPYSDF